MTPGQQRIAVLVALSTSLCASIVNAQEEQPTTIALQTSRDCASDVQVEQLADAVSARVPRGRIVRNSEAVEPKFRLVWAPNAASDCELTLFVGEERSTLGLAAGADEGAVRNAASRVAWLISASVPEPEPEPGDRQPEPGDRQPEPDDRQPEPDDRKQVTEAEPEPEPEPTPEQRYRTVPLHASLVPWLTHPEPPGGDIVSTYSLNVIGYQAGFTGVELGFILNVNHAFGRGLQAVLGGNIVGGELDGAQLALGFNWAGVVDGAQVAAGVNVAAEQVDGGQVSMLNVAGDVAGLQVGMLNIGRKVDGLQVGLLNIASESDVSVGLVNINYDRPLYLSTWADELGMIRLGLQHGSKYLHWTLAGGASPFGEGLASVGVGLGGHFPVGSLYLEVDGMVHGVSSLSRSSAGVLSQFRLTLGLPLGERFALYGGVSANMLASEPIDNSGQVLSFADTGFARRIAGGGTTDLWTWPGFFLGMRL